MRNRRLTTGGFAALVFAAVVAARAAAAPAPALPLELKPRTAEAYDRYVRMTDERNRAELAAGKVFLKFDALPAAQRNLVEEDLRNGVVNVEPLATLDATGKSIAAPDGMIHHWIGSVFIPGASVAQVLALVQDYENHAVVYKPEVLASRILQHDGSFYRVHFRFLKKKVLTVVLNTDHDVRYETLSDRRTVSRSFTTRIAEVENPGESDEREKPVGRDSGFMWRLDTWWRFEEREGGTFVQCESVSLSRSIPTGFGWIVGPFVKSIPKESLLFSLGTTRSTVIARHKAAAVSAR